MSENIEELNYYGIKVENITNPLDIQDLGYKKVSSEGLAKYNIPVDQIIAFATGSIANETLQGAYKLVVDPTKLQDGWRFGHSKLGKEIYNTNIYNPNTPGVATQAGFKDIDLTPLKVSEICNLVMAISSYITGQYFLKEIDNRLSSIESTSQDILNFLEINKRSQLAAQNAELMEIYKNINAIKNNDFQRQAFISCVEGVRQNSLSNIIFYKNYTESALINDRDVEKKITHVSADIPAYWYSLHNYGIATALLIMISDINDKEYLECLQNDLIDKYNQYSEFFKKCKEEMDKYIAKANPDNIPFLFINGGFNKDNTFALGTNPFEKKKKEMKRYQDNVDSYEEAGGIKDIADEIQKYNKLINNPVDMVYMSGNFYIKDE